MRTQRASGHLGIMLTYTLRCLVRRCVYRSELAANEFYIELFILESILYSDLADIHMSF